MEITDIRIKRVNQGNPENTLKAYVSMILDNEFAVHDIKIIQGSRSLMVGMPNRKTPNDEFRDICYPIKQEVRDKIQTAILCKYEAALLEEGE